MVYRVDVTGEGGVLIDHATTVEMGAGGASADYQRELALSYARTGVAQATRQGYTGVTATVREQGTGRIVETIR